MSELSCPECGSGVSPVWGLYRARTSVDGAEGSATLRMPLHRCAAGHVSGWRAGEDFLGDLALEVDRIEDGGLNAGTVAPRARLLRAALCGSCGSPLVVRASGERLRATMQTFLRTCPDPVQVDFDIPAAACSTCGARPDMESRAVAETMADIGHWFFQFIADAMPPERAADFLPRGDG